MCGSRSQYLVDLRKSGLRRLGHRPPAVLLRISDEVVERQGTWSSWLADDEPPNHADCLVRRAKIIVHTLDCQLELEDLAWQQVPGIPGLRIRRDAKGVVGVLRMIGRRGVDVRLTSPADTLAWLQENPDRIEMDHAALFVTPHANVDDLRRCKRNIPAIGNKGASGGAAGRDERPA